MAHVVIYTKPTCPFCHRAKHLLEEKGSRYEEIDIAADPARRSEMMTKAAGKTTVPQIFIDGRHIGGCDDIYALDREGQLDSLLRHAS
jgi:glutaredoxin 3